MGTDNEIDRRSLIVRTAGAIGAAGAITGVEAVPASAQTEQPIPPGFDVQKPLVQFWNKPLNQVVEIDLRRDAPDLADAAARERHRIYCHLLMKLIARFWNGNKRGPLGTYPLRAQQKDVTQLPQAVQRYRGDMADNSGGLRVNWDRYLGHNIACLAIDGNGEIMDFDFNHNDLFRSSAEHAESRMVRRLFSLTDIFDTWRTGQPIAKKPKAASLNEVTLYTTLESCAQCSGVMSLAGIKQIVYLQNDFTAYKIGNIMYNLANRSEVIDPAGKITSLPGAPIPIPASEVGLAEFDRFNDAYLTFTRNIRAAGAANPPDLTGAFFVPEHGEPDFDPSVTSFLCTDDARAIFISGGQKLDSLTLGNPAWKPAGKASDDEVLSNLQCLEQARRFYQYADVEGYRGSPHKL
jgi:tRNA(Arg) A34 adenosine deaminase TadA